MTYVITGACIDVMDQSCMEVCPVDCIHFEAEDRMCFVHPVDCIDCAACESACPVGAIFVAEQVPREAAQFTEINAMYFRDPDVARMLVDKAADGASIF